MASKFAVKVSKGDVLIINNQKLTVEYITVDYVRFVERDDEGRELRVKRDVLADKLLAGEVTFADGREVSRNRRPRYLF